MICQFCGKPFRGRTDKKYCSLTCKNTFHRQTQRPARSYMKQVELTLRQNHAVLAQLPWGDERSLYLPKSAMKTKGFDFQFCTGLFTNNKGRQFFYVYDFAWSEKDHEMIWVLRR